MADRIRVGVAGCGLIAAAQDAGARLMVGTMKRYDPAYQRLATLTPALDGLHDVALRAAIARAQATRARVAAQSAVTAAPAPREGAASA